MPGYGFVLMAGNESAPDNQKRIAAFRRDGLTLAGRTATTSTIITAFVPRRPCPASAKMSCSRRCAISKRASVSAPASRPWRTPCLTSTTPTCRRCRADYEVQGNGQTVRPKFVKADPLQLVSVRINGGDEVTFRICRFFCSGSFDPKLKARVSAPGLTPISSLASVSLRLRRPRLPDRLLI